MSFTAEWAAVRRAHVLGVVARLKPGISIQQATTEMNAIGARLEKEYAENRGEGVLVSPFMNEVVGNVRPALLTLLGAIEAGASAAMKDDRRGSRSAGL